MGCGCKTNQGNVSNENKVKTKSINNTKNALLFLPIRILAFLLSFFLLPIIMIAIIWFMFELLLLNKEIDMKKILTVLSSKIKPLNEGYEEENDYEEEEDDFTEENYEILDVENITPIASK